MVTGYNIKNMTSQPELFSRGALNTGISRTRQINY